MHDQGKLMLSSKDERLLRSLQSSARRHASLTLQEKSVVNKLAAKGLLKIHQGSCQRWGKKLLITPAGKSELRKGT